MMVELIIFAVILVALNACSTLIVYNVMTKQAMNKLSDKDYIKKISKMSMEISKEIIDEMEE